MSEKRLLIRRRHEKEAAKYKGEFLCGKGFGVSNNWYAGTNYDNNDVHDDASIGNHYPHNRRNINKNMEMHMMAGLFLEN
ncbi:hypothetical protein [Butyrivibrio sp. WCD3002]|uniref:hypothetical protein n=1 Tax=Butyrivibrio sp. WCD3002 TaxID=1280676 RepID=UPI0004239A50